MREIEKRKSALPESVLARALLTSTRPARAFVMCHGERHKLARVYDTGADGGLVLAVPRVVLMRSFLYKDVPKESDGEIVFVPWAYRLDGAESDDSTIILRCRCKSWATSVQKVREQMEHLRPGDRYLMVSVIVGARHNIAADTPSARR